MTEYFIFIKFIQFYNIIKMGCVQPKNKDNGNVK